MRTVYSLLLWLVWTQLALSAEQYTLDAPHSKLTFQVRQLGIAVTGRFSDFSGTIKFDRERPERSSVEATIQLESIDTGIAARDHHLLAPDFFNAAKFPTMNFKSTSVQATGEHTVEVHGNLTMHGVTLPVLLHVEQLSADTKNPAGFLYWNVTANLKRSGFGLTWSPLIDHTISDEVEIRMKIATTPAK
jgi:polyisoprenoid-binding protein YceI